MQDYIVKSLELHLFFGRIMKEHALFLEVGYTEADCSFKKEAKEFKKAFEELLCDAIQCSYGVVGKDIFDSGELVTEYTLCSEKATSELTGGSINFEITDMEEQLGEDCRRYGMKVDSNIINEVQKLNQRSLKLLECFIGFKQETLDYVLKCRMFTMNYPLLLEHIIREAKLYQRYIMNLEKENRCAKEDLRAVELFWNQIMMEHALFIRGLLDPTEGELIIAANQFAGDYAQLIKKARDTTQLTMDTVTDQTLAITKKYQEFKEAGTKGINGCEIRSLILPLLADHVLREANHYLRILKQK